MRAQPFPGMPVASLAEQVQVVLRQACVEMVGITGLPLIARIVPELKAVGPLQAVGRAAPDEQVTVLDATQPVSPAEPQVAQARPEHTQLDFTVVRGVHSQDMLRRRLDRRLQPRQGRRHFACQLTASH